MIALWLKAALYWLLKLFVPSPIRPDPVIDPNEKCPWCGARSGQIKAGKNGNLACVWHVCTVCSGTWASDPVLKASTPVLASVPETTQKAG